ncbi:hypothetical protein [Streptomyces sp. LS1784]|uniref:hypothetical protein n=1 Tax=Streptomyces sp. LS1784 TaxID=2851533 RepID=UPI0027E08754|nr:hypothetical protein [Streptomyces sp. LS1784]
MATAVAPTDPIVGPLRNVRDHVPTDLWAKQVSLLMHDYPYDSVMAARVLGQGYAYLLTAMAHRGEQLSLGPSSLVDIGVHTIILDTVAYAELCRPHNDGQFLHHVPAVKFSSPAAHAAVMAAASTLEVADTATLDREEDLPVPAGLLVLPEPVVLANRVGSLSDVAAYGWSGVQMHNGWPPVPGGRPGVRVVSFMDRDGPVQPAQWRTLVKLARTSGTPLPRLVPDGIDGMVGNRLLSDLSVEQLHDRSREIEQIQLAMRANARSLRPVSDEGEWSGGIVEDLTQDFTRRYIFAFWRLASHRAR